MRFQATAESTTSTIIDLDETFLPVGHMRQITRITAVEDSAIGGEMELGPGHWVWPEHFPADPIFPATLIIEGAGQLVALWTWMQGQRGRPRMVRTSAEFLSPVGTQTQRLLLQAEVRRRRKVSIGSVLVYADAVQVARVEAWLMVLPAESGQFRSS